MSAFYVARVKIKDGVKLQDYSSKAMPIFASFGGELVSRGELQADDQSAKDHDFTVVMNFPSLNFFSALNSANLKNFAFSLSKPFGTLSSLFSPHSPWQTSRLTFAFSQTYIFRICVSFFKSKFNSQHQLTLFQHQVSFPILTFEKGI